MFFSSFEVQTYIKETESYYDHQIFQFGKIKFEQIKFVKSNLSNKFSQLRHQRNLSILNKKCQNIKIIRIPDTSSGSLSQKQLKLPYYIIKSEMYQLTQRNSKMDAELLPGQHDIVLQNRRRSCTDVLCLALFILLVGVFIGLLIYALIEGNPSKIFNVYNAQQKQCYLQPGFQYGFFPTLGSLQNAVCVNKCPSQGDTVTCLNDGVNCQSGQITALYSTKIYDYYCLPTTTINNQDIWDSLNQNVINAWAYDLHQGWVILLLSAFAAMAASIFFLLVVRCCTGLIIWVFIIISILGMELVGILFILQAKGITVSSFVSTSFSTTSYNSLIIIGSGLIIFGVILALVVVCMRSRIALGSKSVQLGAMFLLENCCVILLPITQAFFIAGGLAAIIAGGIYLYSLGTFTFPNNIAFPVITMPPENIVLLTVYLIGGFWLIFYFHGCNHFILCSATSIWYFNHESPHDQGAPFGDSIYRLIRFHTGSVAITSLVNSLFFIVKVIAHILSFKASKQDKGCTLVCIKILSCIFCIFQCFLRLLNDGTYVQIAVTGKGYCRSTFKAFSIISDNIAKISITDGISKFFTTLGVLGIGIGVTVAAFFACQQIEYFAKTLTNPIIVTLTAGLIAFVVAGIYLSMIELSALSIVQCYFIDHEFCNGFPRYAKPQFKEIILVQE